MAKELTQEEEAVFAAMQTEPEERTTEETVETEAPEGTEQQEQPAGQGKTAEAGDQRVKTVPHAAMHEERERRKAVEAENVRLREERARFDERLKVIQELNKPKEDEPDLGPDPEADPVGAIKWMRDQQARLGEQSRRSATQQEEAQREQAMRAHLVDAYRADASQFRQQNPDFGDAYQHLLKTRQDELSAIGYSPAEINAAIEADELAIAQRALSNGRSAAEVVYNLAKQRGYAKKEAADPNQDAGKRIEKIAEGQERGKSLAQAGGTAAGTEMTAERLLKMSNAEFEDWTARHPAQAKRLLQVYLPLARPDRVVFSSLVCFAVWTAAVICSESAISPSI